MAGDKTNGGGWRSRFSKKSTTDENAIGYKDVLAEPFNLDKPRSRGGKMSSILGFDGENYQGNQPTSRQHYMADGTRSGGMIDDDDIRPTVSPDSLLHERSPGSIRASKLERMTGESSRSASRGSNTKVPFNEVDVDETSCPVCLELLSFRLAGEKPHVTPACGHALHHACFTAVYGAPEAIMAAQTAPGRATPPGMCGVCRTMISLGDEGETRRQNSEYRFLLRNNERSRLLDGARPWA